MMNNQANMFYNFEQQNHYYTKVFHCQICRDQNHGALFCMKASCFYCKSKEHVSYHCRATEHVLRLICKLCSTEGLPIDACKLGTMPNNYCQYCQNMGHEVTQCPTIAEHELCWKVRKEDTIRLRAIRYQELRNHVKAVAVRHTRSKIARQHCVRGATTSGTQ